MNKFITILLIITFNYSSFALAESMVNARTAIVIDYHSDKVLYEYEPDIQIYPASMTKIMTTIVAFDLIKKNRLSLDDRFVISENAWRLSERRRLKNIPPQITDDAVLARKYFGEAVKLDPKDARYLGFHSSMLMSEGSIHNDEYLTRKGYLQGLESIDSWPQFNLFTIGYSMSLKDYTDPRFAEALEIQWENIDVFTIRSVKTVEV